MSRSNDQSRDAAILLLRIGVGLIFTLAGWGKLTGIEGVQQFFGQAGIPMANLMAWVVALTEFVGGLMVLTGTWIRIPTVLLSIIMVVAILKVKMSMGFDAMRIDIMLLVANLALYMLGSGTYSIDHRLNGKTSPATT